METTEQDIILYIKEAVKDHGFLDSDITLTGSSDKSEGYASRISFATVVATDNNGTKKSAEVVVKSSRKRLMEVNRDIYRRETYLYGTVFPVFNKFQAENNIENSFNSIPRCYKTISGPHEELIVMENLRKNGYSLYDCKKPLDLNHLNLVLREYGKLHAISFALKNKTKVDFDKLVANFDEIMLGFFIDSFKSSIRKCFESTCDVVAEVGDKKLYGPFYKVLEKGADNVMMELLETVEPDSAILHGDCWSNNFLYQYETSEVPSKVAILDWQLSRLHSPVLDLSYFIYATCSKEELEHFDELLGTYYASFSKFLSDLDCDPESIFSFSTLRSHWKKYSIFGVLMTTTFLHLSLCEKEDIPDLGQCEDQQNFADTLMNIKVKNESAYKGRLVAVISHYCNYYNRY